MPFILIRLQTVDDLGKEFRDDLIKELKKTMVISNCPEGDLRIENIYWCPLTEEIVVKTEDK